jgi:uncharacterized membrane protein YphA (DoxX/SURF4 family)
MIRQISDKLDNSILFSYFILAARVLLALIFFTYGLSKLTGNQFGLSDEELLTPIGELSNFRVSWYLFDLQPFKAFVGVAQVMCGILLLWNRTVLLGAFLFIPIAANILVMDITFMHRGMAEAFAWRLSYYLLLDALIIWYYRDTVISAWKSIVSRKKLKFNYSVWVYLSLPLAAIILEFLSPRTLYHLMLNPLDTIESVIQLIRNITD